MSERVSLARHSRLHDQGERLAERRRRRRRRILKAFTVIVFILVTAAVYVLNQNRVRITRVEIFGGDTSLASTAQAAMQGRYFGIIPRNSIFFIPDDTIRSDILTAHPDIAAISIFRNGLTGLSIRVTNRAPIARWCGIAPPADGAAHGCYTFDAGGIIFPAATTTEFINSFTLYAPLVGETLEPLRATIAHAEKIPGIFDFARELSTFGSPVTRVVIRSDEVDSYLESGTRLTYVLGHEKSVFDALASAKSFLNLADGSLDYVDLRFDGKVYLKKR
ncbi:hypothetical protein A3G63_03085 [Candidatus Kaiserbacteria bacterium RIFCSPLOWO2_12_FULL_52_8]|nr:MAG: hypothetical protein A3G63_03085 [Candidatus Kaiserbacteria bacterium RIFCSPLOWO2_12_FULL_52_8]